MKQRLILHRILPSIAFLLSVSVLSANAQTASAIAINNAVGKPDGTNVVASVKIDLKSAHARTLALLKILHSSLVNWDEFEKGARELIRDFPTYPSGYECMMMVVQHYEQNHHEKARQLAEEVVGGPAPEKLKLWFQGCVIRLASEGKPLAIQFTAVDGREVDLAKMKGKVVLVDFWSTLCELCIAELPEVKEAYNKFHARGFEVVGISFDTDKARLQRFLKSKAIPWPQYNDGKQFFDNRLGQEFGIDGIPHMFLIDKKGKLRADNVRAQGDFEEQIARLLEED
jgi:peroxiredoxin